MNDAQSAKMMTVVVVVDIGTVQSTTPVQFTNNQQKKLTIS